MRVLKFGGTSLGSPNAIRAAAGVIRSSMAKSGPAAVVVSAFQGVTDALIDLARRAARGEEYAGPLAELEERHLTAVGELLPDGEQGPIVAELEALFRELADLLRGVTLTGELTSRVQDSVMGFGERLSAVIVAAYLASAGVGAEPLDMRRLVRTDARFGAARIDRDATYRAIREHFAGHPALQVATGFIGATADGETTTLGRGGSDYTASLLGAALDADEIAIWTDVDGVLTADPRTVPDAFALETLTYEEAMELAHFGAKVIYPPTIQPALERHIPLRIKNTFRPEAPGTLIAERRPPTAHPITGLTSISSVTLLLIKGSGMIGAAGTAGRLFSALARRQISVILITQASSEHTICVAVDPSVAPDAIAAVEEEFGLELQTGQIDPVAARPECAIIAAVGEGMRERPGIAGTLFSALGKHDINVVAIAQGSSELNISVVVARKDEAAALRTVHEAFFRPGRATGQARRPGAFATSERDAAAWSPGNKVPVGILGATGSVGQQFVELLADHPWFEVTALAASAASAGKPYGEVVRWHMSAPLPDEIARMPVAPCEPDLPCRIVFSALDASVAGDIERQFADAGYIVVSNARNHRMDPDVPLLVPEVNGDHLRLVERQRRGGVEASGGRPVAGAGMIVTNPNCSTTGLVLAVKPLLDAFGLGAVNVVTLQAASGAGYPGVPSLDLLDNVIPHIGGEEDKLETEPKKILGAVGEGGIAERELAISAACNRVAVLDGHTECVSVRLRDTPSLEDIIAAWQEFSALPQALSLPLAPQRPLRYFAEPQFPQPRLHRNLERGMTVSIGRLRPCPLLGYKFVALVHNTVRGAAGGAILNAELMLRQGYIQ
jgi:aspartate-semialdehyde dehydrogenase